MNTHNGTLYLLFLCCVWPLIVHAVLIYGPRLIRNLLSRIPKDAND